MLKSFEVASGNKAMPEGGNPGILFYQVFFAWVTGNLPLKIDHKNRPQK